MPGATISYSGMERRRIVWPGQGRASLYFTDERAARAAKAAIDAGRPIPDVKPRIAAADASVFMPSRSTKAAPVWFGLDLAEPPVQADRPLPKWPGRAAKIAAAQPKTSKHGRASIDIERARRVYAETGSLAKTAARFGVGWSTMRRHLRKAGVRINPPVRPRAS